MATEKTRSWWNEEPLNPERRRFFSRLSMVLAGLSGLIVGLPVVGFILGPLIERTPETWRDVGRVDDFRIGDTVKVDFEDPSPMVWAGVTARTAAWLRRVGEREFIAFALNCTHLGCPVRWVSNAKLFLCPCHGGAYYADGSVAAGPPPRRLFRYPVRVRKDRVEILASGVPIV